ncbi:hypothetical protein LAZ67_8002846 [Cordylochernes scorpioides]|uniref:Mos1 transposase HTH domain-containing protein n=1 Tax=Cordylochernes scorpioides TaxID=51811 RepID=A0ABY6KRA5_9ARAC|nr:hypothetical protein LAZ67_8002846 [Cordylochernes scorpioides]
MELPLVNVSTCELRSVIRFFTAKNETAVNIHRNLVSVYGEGCMSIQMVRRWRSWFLEGRQNVHDDERSDRPVTATDNAAVAAVRNVVEANRRVTIDEIMIRLPPGIEIGCSSIGTIMSDVLKTGGGEPLATKTGHGLVQQWYQKIATTVGNILHEELGMRKLCSGRVPYMPNADQNQMRKPHSQQCLDCFKEDMIDYVRRFVTVGETWVHH